MTMNILIAADGTTLDSSVAKRFGHAPYYLYVDADTRQVQVIENTDHDDETHAIIPQMIQQGVDVFITGNIGPHAFQLIKSLNRQVAGSETTRQRDRDVFGIANASLGLAFGSPQ